MLRRTCLRKTLIAALALAMAAAPSVAQAGPYGTPRTSPFQFINWLSVDLHDVTVTHYYGMTSETFQLGTIKSNNSLRSGTVHFYTNGMIYAGDYWTITANFTNADGNGESLWRSLDHYDLHAVDAGVMVTMDMKHGSYTYQTGNNLKLDYYSNNGSWTNLPVYSY